MGNSRGMLTPLLPYHYTYEVACLQLHEEYSETELFLEEINKLMPYMDEGSTHYMEMIQQLN
jgi:hypothetical protein